jgi:hypothetical protein
MDIVIGRESGAAEPRLCLKTGTTTKYIGAAGSVPRSVSRSHCVISIDGNNNLTINNVSDQNALYVNGMEYKSKSISETDLVELGPERYRLDIASVVKAFKSPAPSSASTGSTTKSYNIGSLKRIWNDYTQAKLDIQIRERKIGALSAIPGVLSMISIALSFIPGLRGIFITIAGIGAVSFAVIRVKSAANVPIMQKELDEKFQDNYICPHCSHFLGNQRYELILRNGGCPWCKSKFTE